MHKVGENRGMICMGWDGIGGEGMHGVGYKVRGLCTG